MDNKFYPYPKKFYKLYNIIGKEKNIGVITHLSFILMTHKSYSLYYHAYYNLHEATMHQAELCK